MAAQKMKVKQGPKVTNAGAAQEARTRAILEAVRSSGGDLDRAARALGWQPVTFSRHVGELGIRGHVERENTAAAKGAR